MSPSTSSVVPASDLDGNSDARGNNPKEPNKRGSHPPVVKLAKPLSPEAREALTAKTVKLMRKRARLSKKLAVLVDDATAPAASSSNAPARGNTGILLRMERLARRERRHMISRTKLLEEREKLYRWDPTDERAVDLDLVRSLLSNFRQLLYSELKNDPDITLASGPGIEEVTSGLALPTTSYSAKDYQEDIDAATQLQSKEGRKETVLLEQRPKTAAHGTKNATDKANQHDARSRNGRIVQASPELAVSEQLLEGSNLRYDQLRVKEMLSGLAYDDLVYDAEPVEGKRVIDHGLWMSGALEDVSDRPEILPVNHGSALEIIHSPQSITTPVKSAIKKKGESRASVSGRRVTFGEVSNGGLRAGINEEQPSSPTYRYSLNRSAKKSESSDGEGAQSAISKRNKSHTNGISSTDLPSASLKTIEKSARHKYRRMLQQEEVNGQNTPAKNDLVQVLGVTPEVSHLASILPDMSRSAPAKFPVGGSTLDAVRREDRIVLETERQIWQKRMGFDGFAD